MHECNDNNMSMEQGAHEPGEMEPLEEDDQQEDAQEDFEIDGSEEAPAGPVELEEIEEDAKEEDFEIDGSEGAQATRWRRRSASLW